MGNFFDEWIERPKNPNDLSPFTIDYNRWDRQAFLRLLKQMREFQAKRQKLIDNIAGDVGYDVWQDAWLSLWKVAPEMLPPGEVRPSHIINHMVMEEAQELQDWNELHEWTNGDEVGASLACITMEPELETLYDRMQEAQKLADEMDELLQQLAQATQQQMDIEQLWEEWTQENDPSEPENEQAGQEHQQAASSIQEQIEALKQQMAQQGQDLQDALDGARPDVRASLRSMIGKAAEEASDALTAGATWGLDAGQLHRLSAQERIDLAKKLASSKLKEIAKLFGKIKPFAFRMQRQKVDYLREETFDIEIGSDIERVLPMKIAQLDDPDEEDLFYADFLEGKLPQFKMRGQEQLHKGGIILCHDGSGSMSGANERWTKAIGLVLLHIAKKEKRSFYGIQFGSRGQLRVDDFRDTKKISPDAVIDFAEFFFGGGTDFESPLNKAVEILEEENRRTGAVKSDIVLVTDGMCQVSDDWFKNFKKVQQRLQFRVWGCIIGGNPKGEPLHKICDGQVFTIQNLTSGEEIGKIFRSI